MKENHIDSACLLQTERLVLINSLFLFCFQLSRYLFTCLFVCLSVCLQLESVHIHHHTSFLQQSSQQFECTDLPTCLLCTSDKPTYIEASVHPTFGFGLVVMRVLCCNHCFTSGTDHVFIQCSAVLLTCQVIR